MAIYTGMLTICQLGMANKREYAGMAEKCERLKAASTVLKEMGLAGNQTLPHSLGLLSNSPGLVFVHTVVAKISNPSILSTYVINIQNWASVKTSMSSRSFLGIGLRFHHNHALEGRCFISSQPTGQRTCCTEAQIMKG